MREIHDMAVMRLGEMIGGRRYVFTSPIIPSHWSPDADADYEESGGRHYQGTILLADGEPLVMTVGQHILEEAGYRVITAADGEEALEVYRHQSDTIDLVILDYVMPKLNGFETRQRMAAINENVRVLFWSGYLADRDLSSLLQNGLCEFIAKPYNISDLIAKVRTLLGREEA